MLAKRPHPSSSSAATPTTAGKPCTPDGVKAGTPQKSGRASVRGGVKIEETTAEAAIGARNVQKQTAGATATRGSDGSEPVDANNRVPAPSASGVPGAAAVANVASAVDGASRAREAGSATPVKKGDVEKATPASTSSKAPTPAPSGAVAAATATATAGRPSAPVKKARKPYTISRQRENWTANEHQLFLDALKKYGRSWKQIEAHVRTKNVIQIRSHAQKYFLKLQKNNIGEHVPPPRPKRRSAMNGGPAGNVAGAAGTPPLSSTMLPGALVGQPFGASAGALQGNPHSAAAAAYVAAQQIAHQQAQAGTGLGSVQMQPGALAHDGRNPGHIVVPPQQQQQFAAAVQQHLQMLQFGSISPASNPFFAQHALRPIHAALNPHGQLPRSTPGAQTLPRANAAKAISPRLPPDAAPPSGADADASVTASTSANAPASSSDGRVSLPFRLLAGGSANMAASGFPSAFSGLASHGRVASQQIQPTVPHQLLNQQRHLMQLNPMLAGSAGSMVSDGSLTVSGSGTGSGSVTAPVSPLRSASVPGNVGSEIGANGGQSAAAAAAAAVAATGTPVGSGASPNFTRIYGFFAELFNPLVPRIVEEIVSTVESSTLDCEIIKLLVRNLEVNLSNDVFRHQLTQTYRDQQITQQQQHEQQVAEQAEQQLQADDSMLWLSGAGTGEASR